ncbi:MAG: hypothetical protein FJ388_12540 [Verrucomicrobia bacterium]|nr:hypothetical protein [Verrucomicrobiota bacterium]
MFLVVFLRPFALHEPSQPMQKAPIGYRGLRLLAKAAPATLAPPTPRAASHDAILMMAPILLGEILFTSPHACHK